MTKVELREWLTTNPEITVPYFRVDMTMPELKLNINNVIGSSTYPGYIYMYGTPTTNPPIGGSYDPTKEAMVKTPFLSRIRWMVGETMRGYNFNNYLGGKQRGEFRFKLRFPANAVSARYVSHQPGVVTDYDRGTWTYDNYKGFSARDFGTGGSLSSMVPLPSETFPWNGAKAEDVEYPASLVYEKIFVQTSDNITSRIDVRIVKSAKGIRGFTVITWGGELEDGLSPANGERYVNVMSRKISEFGTGEEVVSRFNPRVKTSNIGCYIMTKAKLNSFMQDLWNTDALEKINQKFIGDGSNALLGLRWYYGLATRVKTTAQLAYVSLGNVGFKNGPKCEVAREEFVEFYCGSVNVPQFYGDYRDLSITTYQVYLPFVGIIDLAPQDLIIPGVMWNDSRTLYLTYWVNISDGSAVCILSTLPSTPNGQGTIFTTTCSWGYDIPIRVEPVMDALARAASVVGSILPLGEGGGSTTYSSGELTPNSNVMGDFQAKLIINRKTDLSGPDFPAAMGAPGAEAIAVGDATGYLKASAVFNPGTLAMRRSSEIIDLLREGIYI